MSIDIMKIITAVLFLIASIDLVGNTQFDSLFAATKHAYLENNVSFARIYGQKCLETAFKSKDPELITKAFMRLFNVQLRYHAYDYALKTAKKSLEYAPNNNYINRCNYNLGLVYKKLNVYDSALIYQKKAYNYFLNVGDIKRIYLTINEMGLCHYYVGNYKKARSYYKDLLNFASHNNSDKYKGYAINNIGNSYFKENKKDSAIFYFQQALKFNSGRDLLPTYMRLAELSDDKYNYLIKAKNAYSDPMDLNDYKQVMHLLRKYHHEKDSINHYANLIADISLKEIEIRNEAGKIDYRLQLIEVENKLELLAREKSQKSERLFWMSIIGITSLLFLLIFLFIRSYQQRKNETKMYKIELLEWKQIENMKTIRQLTYVIRQSKIYQQAK
jgi:tetratricopeptide (TPR) repeat protein